MVNINENILLFILIDLVSLAIYQFYQFGDQAIHKATGAECYINKSKHEVSESCVFANTHDLLWCSSSPVLTTICCVCVRVCECAYVLLCVLVMKTAII